MSALSLRSDAVNLYKFNQPEGRQCVQALANPCQSAARYFEAFVILCSRWAVS